MIPYGKIITVPYKVRPAIVLVETTGIEPEYQKAPTYAYKIGKVTLDRNNTLIIGNGENIEKVRQLLSDLEDGGFHAVKLPEKLVIQMPRDGFDALAVENLRRLVAAKAELIKKALGAEDLPIEQTNEAICFPWFSFDTPAENITAYSQFITALCDMAKKQKRVIATEKSIENEKYAFRCFLLRLGFIGDEYVNTRKVLLRNLTGNGSWKNGKGEKPQQVQSAPSSAAFEESAEAIGKHLLRGLVQYLETVL
jgi:hypothetical protein